MGEANKTFNIIQDIEAVENLLPRSSTDKIAKEHELKL